MKTEQRIVLRRPRRFRLVSTVSAAAVAIVTTAVLAGFHTDLHPVTPDKPSDARSELVTTDIVGIRTFAPPLGVTVTPDVVYGTQADGALLTLDVCSPAAGDDTSSKPAVVSIHGGSWARGDKANTDWRNVCEWLASEGFVTYSLNYRLAPTATFPAAIDDVSLAVEWMRQPDNVRTYGIDPDRIGAFGGSAGGNLAALLGARASGALTKGSRVAAVAELSGPTDVRANVLDGEGAPEGLHRIALTYLGCEARYDCPAADSASPITHLDASDPPVFIGASTSEFIPLAQSTDYAARLTELGISHELVTVPGSLHSIGILDAVMRTKVAAFLHRTLGS